MNDLELRTRVAALDPAKDLPPLDGEGRRRLLARAQEGSRARRGATRRWGIGLAAGLVALGAVATAVALSLPAGVHRSADDGPATIALIVPGGAASSMCMPVADFAADALAGSTVAFAGTVEQVRGDRVAVRIDRLYRGGPADEAVLDVPADVEDATVLPVGAHVLVAAQDGQVLGCGISGATSPDLQRFYDAAF